MTCATPSIEIPFQLNSSSAIVLDFPKMFPFGPKGFGKAVKQRNVTNWVSPGSSRCGKYPRSFQPRKPRLPSSRPRRADQRRFPATSSRTPGF
jgi:hypothetical protein